MPDIKGWSLSEVKTLAILINIELKYTGLGYVESQSIEIGKKIEPNSVLNITLTEKEFSKKET